MQNPATSYAPDLQWRSYLALMFASLAGLVWIYRETAQSLLALWQSSETYAHGFIILPISLYLIWRERAYLSSITPRPSAYALAILAVPVTGWIIAQSAAVQVIAQYMFVAMISALTASLLGWRVVRAIAFPLAFSLLSVPFGEIFIRTLIDFTADFTVSALQLTGVPVFREGSHFTLPSGSWSVVEACSGLRYLIASFTLGCLYAYLTYRSWWRQVIFIVLSIIVPVIANAVRSYLIVLLGHLSNMQLSAGVDHLIYGWFFFSIVMLLLFQAGSHWREDGQVIQKTKTAAALTPATTPLKAAGFAATALAFAWASTAWLHHLEQQTYNPAPVTLSLPPTLADWTASPVVTGLKPGFPGATATLMQEYRNGNQVVGVYLAFFRNQHQNAKAVSSRNILTDEKSHEWRLVSESMQELHSKPDRVRQNRLIWGNRQLLAWQWYWIGGAQTASPYLAKWLQAKQRLTGRGNDSADVVIFAPYDTQPENVTAIMENFLAQAVPAIEQCLKTTSGMNK